MCDFCSNILECDNIDWTESTHIKISIAYSKYLKAFHILIIDEPHGGISIPDIKYCPFCGEKLVWKGK